MKYAVITWAAWTLKCVWLVGVEAVQLRERGRKSWKTAGRWTSGVGGAVSACRAAARQRDVSETFLHSSSCSSHLEDYLSHWVFCTFPTKLTSTSILVELLGCGFIFLQLFCVRRADKIACFHRLSFESSGLNTRCRGRCEHKFRSSCSSLRPSTGPDHPKTRINPMVQPLKRVLVIFLFREKNKSLKKKGLTN